MTTPSTVLTWLMIAQNAGDVPAAQLENVINLCASDEPITLAQAAALLEFMKNIGPSPSLNEAAVFLNTL